MKKKTFILEIIFALFIAYAIKNYFGEILLFKYELFNSMDKNYNVSLIMTFWFITSLIGVAQLARQLVRYIKTSKKYYSMMLISIEVLLISTQYLTLYNILDHNGIEHGWISYIVDKNFYDVFILFSITQLVLSFWIYFEKKYNVCNN
jgi:hypothetical protein